ncbi:hypothetical protein [Sorangium sp. So ce406]|uniref:hypothetical protein n=1 Tax=Sorangium sp. So ce406 TaxID=3133311 RepID=UPI003F5B88EC
MADEPDRGTTELGVGLAGGAPAPQGDRAGGGGGGAGETPGGSGGEGSPAAGGQTGSGGSDGTGGTDDTADGVYNDVLAFHGEDCDVGQPEEVNNAKLPDLFESLDGARMSKKSQWRCRRAELKKAIEKYIHGEKPSRPDQVTESGMVRDRFG